MAINRNVNFTELKPTTGARKQNLTDVNIFSDLTDLLNITPLR